MNEKLKHTTALFDFFNSIPVNWFPENYEENIRMLVKL
jgi:hypothetical protein